MLCTTCQKEAKEGKVSKGEFTCKTCIARAKKEAWELQVIEKFKHIAAAVQRIDNQHEMVKYDLEQLEEFLKEKGIDATRIPGKIPL